MERVWKSFLEIKNKKSERFLWTKSREITLPPPWECKDVYIDALKPSTRRAINGSGSSPLGWPPPTLYPDTEWINYLYVAFGNSGGRSQVLHITISVKRNCKRQHRKRNNTPKNPFRRRWRVPLYVAMHLPIRGLGGEVSFRHPNRYCPAARKLKCQRDLFKYGDHKDFEGIALGPRFRI